MSTEDVNRRHVERMLEVATRPVIPEETGKPAVGSKAPRPTTGYGRAPVTGRKKSYEERWTELLLGPLFK